MASETQVQHNQREYENHFKWFAMGLDHISEFCYNLTESYLGIQNKTQIISETQDAIRLTRRYLLEEVFTQWSPLNSEISFSFNGGKDCQVLLFIYLGCLWEFFLIHINKSQFEPEYHKFPLAKLPTVFIDQEETFPTLEQFVSDTSERYFLSLYESVRDERKPVSMSEAFEKFLGLYPETKGIVIGIRHTDPYAQDLKPIQRTDPNWPDFIRLQPLLHWKLSHIWSFLLYSGEPICGLYNVGFTSIGSIKETVPNPFLKVTDNNQRSSMFQWEIEHTFNREANRKNGSINCSELHEQDQKRLNDLGEDYLPGWHLIDDTLERAGRLKKG